MKNREKNIIQVSAAGIVTNVLLAAVKFAVGALTHSPAITGDAVNNLTDSSSSILTILGTNLAQKKPDARHPFGYGRIEYLTSLVIGSLVFVSGLEVLKEAVTNILHPPVMHPSGWSIGVLAASILAKVLLGLYTKQAGTRLDSFGLEASGRDALNDAAVSALTIVSSVLFLWFHLNVDGWAGLVIGAMILKSGYDTLAVTVDQIVGERPSPALSRAILEQVESCPAVQGAYDLILNDYGPGHWIGSVNVEVNGQETVNALYPVLHQLQLDLFARFHTYLVFGLYAVDQTNGMARKIWQLLTGFQKSHPSVLDFHGVVVDEKRKAIWFDLTLDFDGNKAQTRQEAQTMMEQAFPGYQVNVTMDTAFVSREEE